MRTSNGTLRAVAAAVAAPKPAFAGSERPEFMVAPVYSAFSRVMLVGLLNVAVVDRVVMGAAFTALKTSPRNSKVLDSWNFQKWNLRATDRSGIIWGQYRM